MDRLDLTLFLRNSNQQSSLVAAILGGTWKRSLSARLKSTSGPLTIPFSSAEYFSLQLYPLAATMPGCLIRAMCCGAYNATSLQAGLEERPNGNMRVIKFLLRQGDEPDRSAIFDLLASYEMESDLPASEFIVAEIDGQLVGAARVEWEDQAAYVRPILVDSAWHGQKIGKALIRTIAQNLPALYVVARGEATGFYRKLGFLPMPWDQVPERYRQECEACPISEACCPEPMILTGSSE